MSEDVTKRMAEIRARAEAATLGPWRHHETQVSSTGIGDLVDHEDDCKEDCDASTHECDIARTDRDYDLGTEDDAAFIANARQDVPWLLDEIELALGAEQMAVARWKELLLRAKAAEEALAGKWPALDEDDRALPEDAEIDAAFPTRSGRHDIYAEAMRLVGARRSKGGLVALVNWLLLRVDRAEKRPQITLSVDDSSAAIALAARQATERAETAEKALAEAKEQTSLMAGAHASMVTAKAAALKLGVEFKARAEKAERLVEMHRVAAAIASASSATSPLVLSVVDRRQEERADSAIRELAALRAVWEADVKFWQEMTLRARCGCLAADCQVHGAYASADLDRVQTLRKERT